MLLPVAFSFFLSTPASFQGILPSLDQVLPSLSSVLLFEGRILALDLSFRSSRSPLGATPGSGYAPGTYTDVALDSALDGSGATATLVVGDSGAVQSVSLSAFGGNYQQGETLTVNDAALGGGSGFSVDVGSVASTLPTLEDLDGILPVYTECATINYSTGECSAGFTRYPL